MTTLMGIGPLGTTELLVILGICVLLFGASRIPQLARSMGKSLGEFKKGMSEGGRMMDETLEQKDEAAGAKTEDKAGTS
ncbi:MAG: twin-arginine translocase TatA/TatE family subunit [Candidatus Brocadiae bacterium]|nr:twin-arginine translocase TatA/TatE family subunit [Candidatus Brocadiia bacterium]